MLLLPIFFVQNAEKTFFENLLDIFVIPCYNSPCSQTTAMERWLSWSKAHDWKSCRAPKALEGSNPSLSAIRGTLMGAAFFICRKRHGTRREGFEQPVPAVLRPGGQKSPCGAFLGCGSANPSLSAMAQRLRALCFLFARNSSRDTQKSAPRCAPNVAAGVNARPTEQGKRTTNRNPARPFTPAGRQDPAAQNEANKQWFHNPRAGPTAERHLCLPYKQGSRVRGPKTLPYHGISRCKDMVYSFAHQQKQPPGVCPGAVLHLR